MQEVEEFIYTIDQLVDIHLSKRYSAVNRDTHAGEVHHQSLSHKCNDKVIQSMNVGRTVFEACKEVGRPRSSFWYPGEDKTQDNADIQVDR